MYINKYREELEDARSSLRDIRYKVIEEETDSDFEDSLNDTIEYITKDNVYDIVDVFIDVSMYRAVIQYVHNDLKYIWEEKKDGNEQVQRPSDGIEEPKGLEGKEE